MNKLFDAAMGLCLTFGPFFMMGSLLDVPDERRSVMTAGLFMLVGGLCLMWRRILSLQKQVERLTSSRDLSA